MNPANGVVVRALLIGDRLADGGVGDVLDLGGDEADLAGAEGGDVGGLGLEHPDLVDLVGGAGLHHPHLLARAQAPVEHPHQHDDAEIGVVPGVDQQRLQRRVLVALGRRQAVDDGLEHFVDAQARLGRGLDGVGGVDADDVLDLLAHPVRLGGRQVDLVQDRDDLVVVVQRLIDVGQGLGLDALAGVDHQDRSLARRQRAADLIGEVDVAGRVHQVEDVGLAVVGAVGQAHGLGLDGDAALALDVHRVEHLLLHLARGQAARLLDQAIGQSVDLPWSIWATMEKLRMCESGVVMTRASSMVRPASGNSADVNQVGAVESPDSTPMLWRGAPTLGRSVMDRRSLIVSGIAAAAAGPVLARQQDQYRTNTGLTRPDPYAPSAAAVRRPSTILRRRPIRTTNSSTASPTFMGVTAESAGAAIERAFKDNGRPTGYIAGEEGSGAFVLGLRYGRGLLYMKDRPTQEVFWQGPSIGFDAGRQRQPRFRTLCYNLQYGDAIYRRFPGVEGFRLSSSAVWASTTSAPTTSPSPLSAPASA